jgi:hypothetical protein
MTASELIASVLRRLSIVGDFDAPTAEQVEQHIETLNDLMSQWEGEGVDVGYSTIESGTETVYAERWAQRAIKTALAVEISQHYDKPVTPELAAEYAEALRVVRKRSVHVEPVSLEGTAPTASHLNSWGSLE